MDAMHSPNRGFDPFAPFVANLTWPIAPEDGHKRLKGRQARTGLMVASIDAAEVSGRAFRGEGTNQCHDVFVSLGLSGRKFLGSSPCLDESGFSAAAASMDATHSPNRGFDPFAPFAALLRN
jgi:hypothetical protein